MREGQFPAFERPRLFDGRDSRPALMKFWCPILLFLIAVELLQPPVNWARLFLAAWFALAAVFFFTMPVIFATPRNLQYRRFLRWHTINYHEILECKRSVVPLLGYVKLKRFVPPWGRLYFVFHTPSAPFLGRSEQEIVLRYIRNKMAGADAGTEPEPKTAPSAAEVEEKGSVGKCLLWAFLAFIWAVFLRVYLGLGIPLPNQPSASDSVLYRWAVSWWQFGARVLDWPYNVVVVLSIFALIMAWRYKRKAWGAAAALGFFLGELVARVLERLP